MNRQPSFLAIVIAALAGIAWVPAAFSAQTITYVDNDIDSTDYSLSGANDPTTLTIASGSAIQSGVLSGTGGLIKEGAGSITISGENTFQGPVTINAGTLRPDGGAALGDVGNVVTINGGAFGNAAVDSMSAFIEQNVVANSDFAIDAQGMDGVVEIFGNVDLGAATTRTITLTSTGLACFGGSISGQNVTFVTTAGTSQLMMCSATSNIFTGTLRIGSGITYELQKVADNVAVSGNLLIDADATAILEVGNQFASTSDVEVNGTLVADSSETNHIHALTGNGGIHAVLGDTLEVESGTYGGAITEDGGAGFSLHKTGAGTLTLGGTSSFTGGTVITGGTLALGIDNALPTTGALTLDGGALALAGHDQALGTLTLGSNSTIDFNSLAAALAFANSSAISWSGTLTITGFDAGTDTLRFGTDITGLAGNQLSSLRFADYGDAPGQIDAMGFVTAIPEPSAWGLAMGVGLLGVALLRRKRRFAEV